MKYVPGRKLEVTTGKKGKAICLREERISGIPHSFKRLDSFLKDKRRDLKDYVRETSEYGAKKVGGDNVDNVVGEQLEVGPEMELGDSDDEEELSDGNEDDDSD